MASIDNFKKNKPKNMAEKTKSPNRLEEVITGNEKFMEKVRLWTSFYRKYPFIFVKDFLGIELKLFQKIILYMMFNFNFVMFLASRGLGKSWLTSVLCVCKCILYSKMQVVVASGNLKQATQIIKYIGKMREESECLDNAISYYNDKPNTAEVKFNNGSSIIVVASNSGARSGRANLLIIDEFILVDKNTINTVLRKFKANPRNPGYMNNPKYKKYAERNQEIYLSSAGAKWHWSYKKFKAFFNSMMNGRKYFLCDLPYQLTIKDGLRMREEVLDEMTEDDFDPLTWKVEMEGMWMGENESSYFKFDDLEPNRKINMPIYPKVFYERFKSKTLKYIDKKEGEIRFVSADIALMGGKQNDNSIFSVFRLIPCDSKVGKYYLREIVYIETMNGKHSSIQACRIRQLYDDFDCDYIVLDCNGNGMSVYDDLVEPIYDKERCIEYEPFTSMNDKEMEERCQDADAPKKIYSMKAYGQINSDCAISFKSNLAKGKIRLLLNENEGRSILESISGFNKLDIEIQAQYIHPYMQTSSLVTEMINLEGSENPQTKQITLKEQSGQRKDRWSSVSYGNYFANILEKELKKQEDDDDDRQYVWF